MRRSQPIGEQECVHLSRVAGCEMTWTTETAEHPPLTFFFFIINLHKAAFSDSGVMIALLCWRYCLFWGERERA